MAKRRLSHQQKRRIKQAQQNLELDRRDHLQGLVISHHGGEIEIEPDADQPSDRSNIYGNPRANLGQIVCGDRVLYQNEKGNPAIIGILPRQNLLQRQDGFGQLKTIAANVSQLLICLAVEPEPNLFLLDQYLLSAEHQGIQALIVLNKIDLFTDNHSDPFNLKAIYEPAGYDIIYTSIVDNRNIEALQQRCIDHVNVISGVSGVGKSSLTKAILPEQEIQIREISQANREGRHTTRTSRLYHLPLGGDLIDTPGVRGFRPVVQTDQSVASGFRDIADHAQYCRFNNCRHINEPGCAVLAALNNNEIHPSRYQNYVKLFQESNSTGQPG